MPPQTYDDFLNNNIYKDDPYETMKNFRVLKNVFVSHGMKQSKEMKKFKKNHIKLFLALNNDWVISKNENREEKEEENDESMCPICYLTTTESESENIKHKNHHHIFHLECISKWLETEGNTCPICRES